MQAAGGCELEVAGQFHELVEPELLTGGAGLEQLPGVLKPALGLLSVGEFIRLREK